jgi:LmbE family N-acetylglucosaminyl deacetylase
MEVDSGYVRRVKEEMKLDKPNKVVVLSPHSDDAAYSVAGVIRQHIHQGRPVLLVTVFSESTYSEQVLSAPKVTVVEQRRREDERFLALITEGLDDPTQVQASWLKYSDAPLREGYRSGEICISRPLLADDLLHATRLAEELSAVVGQDTDLLAPLGLGCHIDHVITREAALALASICSHVFLYEDLPYATELSPERVESHIEAFALSRGLSLTSVVTEIVGGIDWKIELVRCYTSQFTPLVAHSLVTHAGRFSHSDSERVWRVEYASTEAGTQSMIKKPACKGISIPVFAHAPTPADECQARSKGGTSDGGTLLGFSNSQTPALSCVSSPQSVVPWSIIMIEAVGRCNAACAYCPRGAGLISNDGSAPITEGTLGRALHLAKMGRARAIYLHHRGEPFLHPELEEVVRHVRGAGFGAYLSTNLIAATPTRIDRVLEAGLSQMEIHLSGGATVLPLEELMGRIHHARKSNWQLRNNSCRIEINYGLRGETREEVLSRLSCLPFYDETAEIRFYIPHDWPGLSGCVDRGINPEKCEWFKKRCCAVLSNGDLVICCLDQFRYSARMNVHSIDRIEDIYLSQRDICRGCLQYDWDMDWLEDDALGIPAWRRRGENRDASSVY